MHNVYHDLIMVVPAYYSKKHIRYWSQTKARCPLSYLICEYMVRQPRLRAAQQAKANGDPEADFRINHYKKPASSKMVAGSAIHTAAFNVVNGANITDELDAVWSALRAHQPIPHVESDHQVHDFLLSDNEALEQTMEHAVSGIREAFVGANTVNAEEYFEIDLPGIEIPTVGYCDGSGGGIIGELKTKWDRVSKNSKSGFAVNSLPSKPERSDVQQAALYRLAFGGDAKLIYCNRLGYRVFALDASVCDQAVTDFVYALTKRQNLFKSQETILDLIDVTETDFSSFYFNDYSAELLAEMREIMEGSWEA